MVRRVIAALATLVISGCIALGPDAQIHRLLRRAHESVEHRDFEEAWRSLVRIHREFPAGEYDTEAFILAADVFRAHYDRDRVRNPDSRWVKIESQFMLEWLISGLSRPAAPQKEAERLFLGTTHGYFREYLRSLEKRSEPTRWTVRVEKDNGIIQAVRVEPFAPSAATHSSGD